MPKVQGKKLKKAVEKVSKDLISKKKKLLSKKKNSSKSSILQDAKKKVIALRKKSTKGLTRAKNSLYSTEKEIVNYVKENPVKSVSTVALVSLIAGFVSRLKK